MISRHTKVLLLVAAIGIGSAQIWQHHSRVVYEKSNHPPIFYNLDTKSGKIETNEPSVPLLRGALGLIGMFGLLFGLPLLVKDITQRQRRS
jgi:hypothetical protein